MLTIMLLWVILGVLGCVHLGSVFFMEPMLISKIVPVPVPLLGTSAFSVPVPDPVLKHPLPGLSHSEPIGSSSTSQTPEPNRFGSGSGAPSHP